ncbi:hypothetical protein LINGRAHAP2_LOCUS22803 [Linum grandiflorum]
MPREERMTLYFFSEALTPFLISLSLLSDNIDHALQDASGHTRRDIGGESMKKKVDAKWRKNDALLLLRAFDSISQTLSSLSENFDHAL